MRLREVLGIILLCFIYISCSDLDFSSELNVKPYFGKAERYVCDVNNPPKTGEPPCDIDAFRLCAYSEKHNFIICNEYSVDEGKNGAKFSLPEAEDYKIFFQGFNKAKQDIMLWCGATERISIKKGDKKDISIFIGRCSDFVFTRSKMSVQRAFHTSTRLKDGRILIVGGISSVSNKSCDPDCDGKGCKPYCRVADATNIVEVYDYKKGEFQKVGNLNVPRVFHTATLLEDGTVVIAGGVKSAKLYLIPPYEKPFVMPNSMDEASSTIEIFDPQTNTFKKVQGTISRAMHSAYLSATGKIYAIGGVSDNSGNYEKRIVEINKSTGMVDTNISLTIGRIFPSIVDFSIVDKTSTVIAVIGGAFINESNDVGNSFDIISFFDVTPTVKEHKYSSRESYILSAIGSSVMPMDAGRFLLCGGMFMRDLKIGFSSKEIEVFSNNPLDYAYFFDINNNIVAYPEKNNNLINRRAFSQSLYLYSKNPKILFTGGFESINPELYTDLSYIPFNPSRSVEVFLVNSDSFDSIHPIGIVDTANPVIKMNEARAGHSMVVLPDETVLITGGFSSPNSISSTAEVFQPYPVDKDISLLVY